MSIYISLSTVAIPVNYTKEFRKVLDSTTYFEWCDCNIGRITGRCSVVT